jgi:DNA-binding protein Fis
VERQPSLRIFSAAATSEREIKVVGESKSTDAQAKAGSPAQADNRSEQTNKVPGGDKMSTSMIWGSESLPMPDSVGGAGIRSEVAMDNRLNTLREVALTLLREVESLRVSQSDSKRRVKLHDEVQRFEVDLIRSALGRTGGNQTRAAQLLGVKITTLNTKIKRYKIEPVGYESSLATYNEQEAVL